MKSIELHAPINSIQKFKLIRRGGQLYYFNKINGTLLSWFFVDSDSGEMTMHDCTDHRYRIQDNRGPQSQAYFPALASAPLLLGIQ